MIFRPTAEAAPPMQVLLVEDDSALRDLLADELTDFGLCVRSAASAEEAEPQIAAGAPDLVISDLRLPGADGFELLRRVSQIEQPPAFIVITAFGSIPQAVEALKAGAADFLTKPLDLDHLRLSVSRALDRRRLERQVRRFQHLLGEDSFHGMLGRSRVMRNLFTQIRQVAQGEGPVLILGESGVGKELAARAVHQESDRRDKPFLAVNCAGIPESLMESEFFGHEAGAFTGAERRRKGLFAEAGGGVLLLDEISEMPPALQAKLLRVLQEGKVRPVGSDRERSVDVRLIAASNRDLEHEAREGAFREDLFYRLETFTLYVPPIRERGEDFELLAARFLERFAVRLDKPVEGFSAEALELLRGYSFPGNVRELQNAVERAVTFCGGRTIQAEHLPRRLRVEASGNFSQRPGLPESLIENQALPPLAEVESRYIRYVLDRVGGNKRRAASLLGIGRRTLYRRLGEEEKPG